VLFSRSDIAHIALWGFLLFASGSAFADPRREVYGISRHGTVFRFSQDTGVAVPVRKLNNAKVDCIYYDGFAFINNRFYASCEGSGALGKIIRFSYKTNDEEVFLGGLPFVAKWMVPATVNGRDILVLYLQQIVNPGQSFPFSALLDLGTKELNAGFSLWVNDRGVCGTTSAVASNILLLEIGGSNLQVAGMVSGPGFPNSGALGRVVANGGAGCFQVECLLTGDEVYPSAGTLSLLPDELEFDPVTKEVWAVGMIGTLRKLRGSSGYCTGTFQGLPAIRKGVDDSPRVIGVPNAFPPDDPVVGMTRAPNFFDFPPTSGAGVIWKPVEMLLWR